MSVQHADQFQRARAEAHQQPPRRRRHALLPVIGAAAAALVLAGCGGSALAPDTQSMPAATAAATRPADRGLPPWPAPADPYPGIKAAGLSIGPMGMAEHYHAHLDVFVDGKQTPVAADIGIDPQTEEMTALHTHDTRGVIHIEAHKKGDTYTLGQLFQQWSVALTPDQIGALKTGGGKALAAYVNGKKVDGDPAAIVLKPHMQIALAHGTPDPSFTPSAGYQFEPGE
ncbi:hypothetical protein AB0B45_49560 [Nonomuraea sp. NPDC049152]|uniref:hypothetical protein n=1 Tax=Nonomuraea sp. NPDC049152 TaxID=3154350 RepID=UPI003410820A